MKYILILCMVAGLASCKKEQETGTCFTVKVVAALCSDVVVQVMDDNTIGDDNWLNPQDNLRYDNVFLIKNYCANASIIDASMRNGKAYFKVSLTNDDDFGSCITCMAVLNRPTSMFAVKACE